MGMQCGRHVLFLGLPISWLSPFRGTLRETFQRRSEWVHGLLTRTTSRKELHRAFDGLPCVVPPSHVPGVKASLSQRCRALTPNVEAVYTECDHRLVLRKTCHPFFHAL